VKNTFKSNHNHTLKHEWKAIWSLKRINVNLSRFFLFWFVFHFIVWTYRWETLWFSIQISDTEFSSFCIRMSSKSQFFSLWKTVWHRRWSIHHLSWNAPLWRYNMSLAPSNMYYLSWSLRKYNCKNYFSVDWALGLC